MNLMRVGANNCDHGIIMSAHRPINWQGDQADEKIEGQSEDAPSFAEHVRVRIALGVTHAPEDACKIFEEIQSCDLRENAAKQTVVAIISDQNKSKYSRCFEASGEDGTGNPPLVCYQSGRFDSHEWQPQSPASIRFRNQLHTFESWMAPTLVSRLKSHLDHSALVIAAALYSPEQEQALCRILLHRAVDYIYVQDVPELNSRH